jgi:hypothetical protein
LNSIDEGEMGLPPGIGGFGTHVEQQLAAGEKFTVQRQTERETVVG